MQAPYMEPSRAFRKKQRTYIYVCICISTSLASMQQQQVVMEKNRHVLLIGSRIWLWRSTLTAAASCKKPFSSKASNRAAVHGVKLPVPDILDKEQVQKEIERAKQEKQAKRKQIEEALHSHLANYSNPDSDSSSPH